MAKKKSFLEEVEDWEGAVNGDYDPFSHYLDTGSPSLNFTFGNTWGLPEGYSLALWGGEKTGKSLVSNMFIQHLHASDPEGIALKFNTEFRERLQFNAQVRARWGVDNERYKAFECNQAEDIFDTFEQKVPSLIEKGHKVRLCVIDSINGVQGRRDAKAKSIKTQQIGDHALTITNGFKRILRIQRKYNIALIVVCQARAELDELQQMRGHKIKMSAPFGLRHHCEYFMMVTRNDNKVAQVNALGEELRDKSVAEDFTTEKPKGELTGHKIKVTMVDTSCGPRGRVGQFTIDYHRGLVDTHEEVFQLGKARNVIERQGNATYVFGDKKWTGGEPSILRALKEDKDLCAEMVKEMKRRDGAGFYKADDERFERENAMSVLGGSASEEEGNAE